MTWLRKLQSMASLERTTLTFAVACLPSTVAVMVVSPSPAGRTTPPSTTATAGLAEVNVACAVWSPTTAPPSSAATSSRCAGVRAGQRDVAGEDLEVGGRGRPNRQEPHEKTMKATRIRLYMSHSHSESWRSMAAAASETAAPLLKSLPLRQLAFHNHVKDDKNHGPVDQRGEQPVQDAGERKSEGVGRAMADAEPDDPGCPGPTRPAPGGHPRRESPP